MASNWSIRFWLSSGNCGSPIRTMQENKAIVNHIADWLRLEVPVAAIPGTYPGNLLSEGAGSQFYSREEVHRRCRLHQ